MCGFVAIDIMGGVALCTVGYYRGTVVGGVNE